MSQPILQKDTARGREVRSGVTAVLHRGRNTFLSALHQFLLFLFVIIVIGIFFLRRHTVTSLLLLFSGTRKGCALQAIISIRHRAGAP